MELVVGGKGQGKLGLTLARTGFSREMVCDGAVCPLDAVPQQRLINHLHLLIRRLMENGEDPERFLELYLDGSADAILISDEVGCGVVPVGRFEREWRDKVGRICCLLAARADRVERVVAGIPIVIKGE